MIETKTFGFKKAVKMVEMLSLPSALKRKFVARMGRMVIAQAKKNVKEQKTISGAKMAPRSSAAKKFAKAEAEGKNVKLTGKQKRLMFKKMVRSKSLRMKFVGDSGAYVSFGRADYVANKHHHGFDMPYEYYDYPGVFDTSKVQTRLNKEIVPGGCTANMAATMIRLRTVPPRLRNMPGSIAGKLRYLMKNVSRKQALFLIVSAKSRMAKKQGKAIVPARPILGISAKQVSQFSEVIMSGLRERFRAAQHSKLLN